MGPTNIIFIIVLLLVSGFVAWAGDVLGSLLGKRRISLFGLRPRLTSRLIGVFTGILITVVTVLALALTSERIQAMLLRMDDIIRDTTRLQTENAQLGEQNDALMTVIHEGQAQVETLGEQLSTVEEELVVLIEEIEEKTEEIEEIERDRDRLQAEYEASEADLSGQIDDLSDQIASLNQQITDRATRVASLNSQIISLEQERHDLEQQVHSLETGEVKVRENQQLVVFSIDTSLTVDRIYSELQVWISGISANYRNPVTGESVLADNEIETTSEQYVQALEDIREVSSERAIVIVYATENVVEDQPVPIRLEVRSNDRVYSEGSLIYSNIYSEPVEQTEQPYRAIFARFFEDARNRIVNERSLIPITSGEALQLTIDDLVGLAERLEEAGLPAELRIIALTDIYRTDFLVYGQQFAVTILPVDTSTEDVDPE